MYLCKLLKRLGTGERVNHTTSSVGNGQKAPMMAVRKEPS
jgi:hypothetical protein